MRRRDTELGQALTEFAIVVPVVVCLVLFSIYFYELLAVKLKAQEAARYAAWEATSYQLSDYSSKNPRTKNRQLFETARTAIESETWARYEDLDSKSVARVKGVPGKMLNKVRGQNFFLATEWELERVRLRNDEPPELNGNFLFELGFDIGLQIAGWVEFLMRDFDNPYTAGMMGSFLRRQYSAASWGFNDDGYVEADIRISVTNRLLPRHYMDQGGDAWFGNRFLRRTSVDFEEHVELLANPWKLVEGQDVRHETSSGGFFQQVDRFFMAGSEGRAVAQPIAQLARLSVMLGMGGGELPDPMRPVVVALNYGPTTKAGTVNLDVDEGRGQHDTAPYSVIHAYEDTFNFSGDDADGRPGRGNYYMGCAEPMQLGCTDSLSRDNPFGEGIIPAGPDQQMGRGGGRGGEGEGEVAVAGDRDGTLRALACLVTGAAIATLGMLSGGETPVAEADPDDGQTPPGYFADSLPRYPGVAEYPMGSRMRVGGEDIKMAYFVTEDSPIRVAEFYARFWEAHGLRVSQDVTPHGGSVGTVDPAAGAMSVSLVRRAGQTYAFPSILQRPARILDAGDLSDGGEIAAFPGSDGAVRFTADDEGRGSEVLSYGNWAGMRDNLDFYRREMGRKGWRESGSTAPEETRGAETLRFMRHGERADIAISPVEHQQGRVRVLVTRTKGF